MRRRAGSTSACARFVRPTPWGSRPWTGWRGTIHRCGGRSPCVHRSHNRIAGHVREWRSTATSAPFSRSTGHIENVTSSGHQELSCVRADCPRNIARARTGCSGRMGLFEASRSCTIPLSSILRTVCGIRIPLSGFPDSPHAPAHSISYV
jgi:hypothetical protein